MQTFLTIIVGAEVRERCDRSGAPRCCFEITNYDGDLEVPPT